MVIEDILNVIVYRDTMHVLGIYCRQIGDKELVTVCSFFCQPLCAVVEKN